MISTKATTGPAHAAVVTATKLSLGTNQHNVPIEARAHPIHAIMAFSRCSTKLFFKIAREIVLRPNQRRQFQRVHCGTMQVTIVATVFQETLES